MKMKNIYKTDTAVKRGGKVHHVAFYIADTGYGCTSCGIRVLPSDESMAGIVGCEVCKSHMDGRWLRKMAALEEGCDVTAGGGLQQRKNL